MYWPEPVQGTAVVRGRVVDDNGTPIPGARASVATGPDAPPIEAVTDAQGRYELRGLPPRSVPITVSCPGYVARRPWAGPARSGPLKDGEVRAAPDVILVRPGVIAGHVYGPDGAPLVGATVNGLVMRRTGGIRRLVQAGGRDDTDDRGAFRLHSLAPGDYHVLVHSPYRVGPIHMAGAAEGLAPSVLPIDHARLRSRHRDGDKRWRVERVHPRAVTPRCSPSPVACSTPTVGRSRMPG